MFVILSCYFLFRELLFCKGFSWRVLLTFQEYRVGPSGVHLGSCVCVCVCAAAFQSEAQRVEERKAHMMFDQWWAESHWNVMEGLVLCDGGEGKKRVNESFQK